ncbi:MAG: secretory subunit [Phylliscum demangeonii]|nr:MAG: secretory subunit [Phylliscum demangeonii]
MSTDYTYDEQGQFFPFFILTITSLITLPLTYSLLKPSKELENTAPRIQSDFKPQHADLIEGQKRKQRRRERKLKRMLTVLAGWLMIGYMMYLIAVTARTIPRIWDPYDILGISRSASEKAIKSHYKRLSLKFHPDKIRPDPARNETVEALNERFVQVTKAYKALTDDEVRNNYAQYGHPDGKQSMSIGIALPKFIVTDGNGKYVLLMYGLLLGALLPYLVGTWWYGTQRMTKEKVLVASAGHLFREYEDPLSEGAALSTLSAGEEYPDALTAEKSEIETAKVESRLHAATGAAPPGAGPLLAPKDRAALERLEGRRRKVLALLWAYLGRVDLGDSALNDEKFEVAPIALSLNEALLAICLAYGSTGPIVSCFHTSQNLIQAMLPHASPLLQLPHITPAIAQAIEGGGASKRHLTVQQFMRMTEEKRRRLALGPGRLSERQYQTAVSVARQMPVLQIEKAFFKVLGEKFITPGSLVQFVVKARIIPPGSGPAVPDVTAADLDDVDPEEGDLNALLGRKSAAGAGAGKKAAAAAASTSAPASSSSPSDHADAGAHGHDTNIVGQPPLAFAPYFARDHSPRWHVFLADSKQGKMAVPPFTFVSFDKPLYHDDDASQAHGDGDDATRPPRRPTFAIQTLKMQFQAPPQAGQYTFAMHLLCDSYVGTDTTMEVTLVVDEMAKAEEWKRTAEEDEISEPEEDSLAGQMHALKQGRLGSVSGASSSPKTKRSKKKDGDEDEDDDDEDDESDTEGEDGAGDDASATDTDTDTDED